MMILVHLNNHCGLLIIFHSASHYRMRLKLLLYTMELGTLLWGGDLGVASTGHAEPKLLETTPLVRSQSDHKYLLLS